MTRTITDKLVATVVEVTDLGALFPSPSFKGRIGLDLRVERGSITPGKKVRLSGDGTKEELDVVGIEMLSDPSDPAVIRVLCSKPKVVALPIGKVEGWVIEGD